MGKQSSSKAGRQRGRARKARTCPLCGEDFKYLKDHLRGSKHGLSKDAATREVYRAKANGKTRVECPFEECQRKGVCVQRINAHLKEQHRLSEVQVKAIRAGFQPQDLSGSEEGESLEQQEEEEEEGREGEEDPEGVPQEREEDQLEDADREQEEDWPEGGEQEEDEPEDGEQEEQIQAACSSSMDTLGEEDLATLEAFREFQGGLDGGWHEHPAPDNSVSYVRRMATSVGGLRPMVQDPLKLSAQGGFLSISTREKAPGTVQSYLLALKQFATFASARKLYHKRDVQALLSQIPSWQTSLKKMARVHAQKRRLSDEQRVEEILSRDVEGADQTEEAMLGRQLLTTTHDLRDPNLDQFLLARDYLMWRTLTDNIQRSGAVIKLKWEEVDGWCPQDDHHVIRTYNKTLGAQGLTNLVFDKPGFQMLDKYRRLQALTVGPEVSHVFTTSTGGEMQHHHVTRALEKVIGIPATATLLRKAAVVDWCQTGGDMEKLGRQMKHSPDAQRRCYATFKDRANSVQVYKEQQAKSKRQVLKKKKAEWSTEQEATLRKNTIEYVLGGGGKIKLRTMKALIEIQPDLKELAEIFDAKQMQDKIRTLHEREVRKSASSPP